MGKKIIKNLQQLARIIVDLKRQHKKIVFTNGGFNLLHVGHIRSLTDAKSLGDILVVAVNSDSSLRSLKGEDYPIVPEDERLEILEALGCVDFLTLFSEPTVDNLLLFLKPHVHAKGTDYSKETVPEKDTVRSYGGEIAIVGDPKHHSTSSIINSIRAWVSREMKI
jgi:rfaE bifunctional protein nucleotidyltransferase chain/domain